MDMVKAERIIDSAIRAGKIAQNEKMRFLFLAGRRLQDFRAELAKRQVIYDDEDAIASPIVSRASNLGLNESELAVCHEMRVAPADYAAAKRARPHHRDVYGHDASIDINRRTMAAAGKGSNTFVGSASDPGLTSSEIAMAKVLGIPLDRYAGMKPLRRRDPQTYVRLDVNEMKEALSAGRKPVAPQQVARDTQAEQVSTLRTSWRGPVPSVWQR